MIAAQPVPAAAPAAATLATPSGVVEQSPSPAHSDVPFQALLGEVLAGLGGVPDGDGAMPGADEPATDAGSEAEPLAAASSDPTLLLACLAEAGRRELVPSAPPSPAGVAPGSPPREAAVLRALAKPPGAPAEGALSTVPERMPAADAPQRALPRAAEPPARAMPETEPVRAVPPAGLALPDTASTAISPHAAAASSLAGAVSSSIASLPLAAAALPAVPATLAVHAPIGAPAFGAELGARVSLLAQQHVASASIVISPPELGPVEVRIDFVEGAAHISFGVEAAAAREAITQSLPQLRETFAQQGLDLAGTSVGAELPQREGRREPGLAREPGAPGREPDRDAVEAPVRRTTRRLVDDFA